MLVSYGLWNIMMLTVSRQSKVADILKHNGVFEPYTIQYSPVPPSPLEHVSSSPLHQSHALNRVHCSLYKYYKFMSNSHLFLLKHHFRKYVALLCWQTLGTGAAGPGSTFCESHPLPHQEGRGNETSVELVKDRWCNSTHLTSIRQNLINNK